MELIRHDLDWNGELHKRRTTDLIVIHHTASAADITVEDIHQMHLGNGWTGAGYHIIMTPDGAAHEGRPVDCTGAHCYEYNSRSVGVNLVGNFEMYPPTDAQIETLKEVLRWLKSKYGDIEIGGHYEYNSTACPGAYLIEKMPAIIAEL